MGAHICVCPNHSVGRITPMETRAHAALAGTFGYELDITKLTEEEKTKAIAFNRDYHKYNDLIREGDYYRICLLYTSGRGRLFVSAEIEPDRRFHDRQVMDIRHKGPS